MPHYFALLGLGATGHHFRQLDFPLPQGRISWIRWRDREWESGASTPMTFVEVAAGAEQTLLPAEGSEERLDHSADAGRLMATIDDPAPWEEAWEAATAIADVAAGLLAMAMPYGIEVSAIELDAAAAVAGDVVLQEVAVADHDGWHPLDLGSELRAVATFSQATLEEIVARIGPALAHGDPSRWGVAPALTYYRLATLEFPFAPDDVRDIVGNPDSRPESLFHRARAEESFHNTWKAIEAVLGGEPPRPLDRLGVRLQSCGLDPESVPRFPDRQEKTLAERIQRLHRTRDRQSAHAAHPGASPRVAYLDLVEAQWMASEAIHGALESAGAPGSAST